MQPPIKFTFKNNVASAHDSILEGKQMNTAPAKAVNCCPYEGAPRVR